MAPRKPRPTAVSVAIAASAAPAADELQRRRLQYKIYQRHHRARQKSRTVRLESEVAALAREVAQLRAQHEALSARNRGVFAARSMVGGAPAQVVAEFYRVYEHGFVAAASESQARFLRATMVPDVRGPDFRGVEALVHQWQIYGSLFHRTHYASKRMTIETYGDVTVVVADVDMTIRPTRHGAVCLYPNIVGDEASIQLLVTNPVRLSGSVRFVFDASGCVTWFGADMDFVSGLMDVLGSAKRVSKCVQGANMSLCTGRIVLSNDGVHGWREEPNEVAPFA